MNDIKKAEITGIRLKIVIEILDVTDIQRESLKFNSPSDFDIVTECYEMRKCLENILQNFDRTEEIEIIDFNQLEVKYLKQKHKKISRILKLLKIKYEL